ncbi:hypothetical protein EYF80_017299 [Liparis tanakae]|uniref:Uncharacterized protein n=1 Tax=Liparis tanakae TaxID=230148 RepID=A0A4Z2I5M2_9TELE|nr:hypothetical protein EYF80_017299 [Liparis tanakae]
MRTEEREPRWEPNQLRPKSTPLPSAGGLKPGPRETVTETWLHRSAQIKLHLTRQDREQDSDAGKLRGNESCLLMQSLTLEHTRVYEERAGLCGRPDHTLSQREINSVFGDQQGQIDVAEIQTHTHTHMQPAGLYFSSGPSFTSEKLVLEQGDHCPICHSGQGSPQTLVAEGLCEGSQSNPGFPSSLRHCTILLWIPFPQSLVFLNLAGEVEGVANARRRQLARAQHLHSQGFSQGLHRLQGLGEAGYEFTPVISGHPRVFGYPHHGGVDPVTIKAAATGCTLLLTRVGHRLHMCVSRNRMGPTSPNDRPPGNTQTDVGFIAEQSSPWNCTMESSATTSVSTYLGIEANLLLLPIFFSVVSVTLV